MIAGPHVSGTTRDDAPLCTAAYGYIWNAYHSGGVSARGRRCRPRSLTRFFFFSLARSRPLLTTTQPFQLCAFCARTLITTCRWKYSLLLLLGERERESESSQGHYKNGGNRAERALSLFLFLSPLSLSLCCSRISISRYIFRKNNLPLLGQLRTRNEQRQHEWVENTWIRIANLHNNINYVHRKNIKEKNVTLNKDSTYTLIY